MSELLMNFPLCEIGLGALAAAQGGAERRLVRFCERDARACWWLVPCGLRNMADVVGWTLVIAVFDSAFLKIICFDF